MPPDLLSVWILPVLSPVSSALMGGHVQMPVGSPLDSTCRSQVGCQEGLTGGRGWGLSAYAALQGIPSQADENVWGLDRGDSCTTL